MKLCKKHEEELIKMKNDFLDMVKQINILLNGDPSPEEVQKITDEMTRIQREINK